MQGFGYFPLGAGCAIVNDVLVTWKWGVTQVFIWFTRYPRPVDENTSRCSGDSKTGRFTRLDGSNDDARAILERIVRGGDRVKFAGGVASPDDCKDALTSTRDFVRETTLIQKEDAA